MRDQKTETYGGGGVCVRDLLSSNRGRALLQKLYIHFHSVGLLKEGQVVMRFDHFDGLFVRRHKHGVWEHCRVFRKLFGC